MIGLSMIGLSASAYSASTPSAAAVDAAAAAVDAAPIIGGWGAFRYQYDPTKMQLPAGANAVNCHGLVTDSAANIYLTYENDGGKTDSNCLVRWKPDGTSPEWMTGGGDALCNGTAHGLKLVAEGGTEYLYHANNNQKLTKTTLDGTVVWQRNGYFGQDPQSKYRPTWWALPPDSKHAYLCDGYGSNHVYVFDRATGEFTNRTFGGQGDRSQHGKFSTNHGCTYDPRNGKIAVSDRANSRFEYFDYDKDDPDKFDYAFTVDMQPSMGAGTLPCNLRMYPDQEGRAISPDLAGPVAVLDASNTVISVVNVSGLLAADHHDHPHDAIFLPNGDMVVATWNPGRLSYWKKL